MRHVCVAVFAGVLALATSAARVEAAGADASHGRIEGDLAVVTGLGAVVSPRGPRMAADLRLRYLWSAGLFVTYEDGPLVGSSAEPRRALATGLEVRPLFLARWARGLEIGSPYPDLIIDSFAIELGAVFLQPRGESFGSKPGLQAGLGLEVPFFPRASGLWIGFHGGLRWSDAALAGTGADTASDRGGYLLVSLSWQQVFGAHVVDLNDRAP